MTVIFHMLWLKFVPIQSSVSYAVTYCNSMVFLMRKSDNQMLTMEATIPAESNYKQMLYQVGSTDRAKECRVFTSD